MSYFLQMGYLMLYRPALYCPHDPRLQFLLQFFHLVRCDIKGRNRQLLHGIIIILFLNVIYWPIRALSNQINNSESTDKLFRAITNIHELSHFLEILLNLFQTFYRQLFVNFLQKRYIGLEIFIEITYIFFWSA